MKSCLLLVVFCAIAVGLTNAQLLNSRFNARKENSDRLLAGTTNLAHSRLGGFSQPQYGSFGSALAGVSPLSSMSSMGGRLGKKSSSMMSPYSTGLGGFNGLTGYGGINPLSGMGSYGALNSLGGLGMLGGMNSMPGLMTPELKPKGAVYNLRNYEEEEQQKQQARKRMGQGKAGKKKKQRQRAQVKSEEEKVEEVQEEEAPEVVEEQPKPIPRGKKQQNRTRKLSKKMHRGKGKQNVIDAITLNQDELDDFIDAKKKNHEKPGVQGGENGQIQKLSARFPTVRQGRLE